MKKIGPVLILFLGIPSAVWPYTLSGFDAPESMAVDPDNGAYYVSNINGDPAAKDGNGYISKINSNGNTIVQKFIGGTPDEVFLDAPKGLTVVGKNIFVTDIDAVKGFDEETRKPSIILDLSSYGAKFLNDIAADQSGVLYVSDTMTDQIFKIDPNKKYEVTLFSKSSELGGPNGVLINPKSKNLVVVTWRTGRILEINPSGKIHILKKGLSTLDGVDYDNEGNLYVSNFEKGEIYKVAHFGRGPLSTFMTGLTTPADLAFNRKKNEILVPSSKGNTISTYLASKK